MVMDQPLPASSYPKEAAWCWTPQTGELVYDPRLPRLLGLSPSAKLTTPADFVRRALKGRLNPLEPANDRAVANFEVDWPHLLRRRTYFELTFVVGRKSQRRLRVQSQRVNDHTVGRVSDITHLTKAAQEELDRARYDVLTGLWTRRHFEVVARRWLEEVSQSDSKELAWLVIDMRQLKLINDINGHPVGDCVLAEVGRRLGQAVVPDEIIVGRYGGDEFVAVIKFDDEGVLRRYADHIQRLLGFDYEVGPFDLDVEARRLLEGLEIDLRALQAPKTLQIKCDIGMATTSVHVTSLTQLHRRADVAMYYAKNTQLGHPAYYDGEIEAYAEEQLATVNQELIAAVREGFDLECLLTIDRVGNICGVEFLLANNVKKVLGYREMEKLIATLAQKNLLLPSEMESWRRAFDQLTEWRSRWPQLPMRASVNLPQNVLRSPLELREYLKNLRRVTKVDPSWVTIEVSEVIELTARDQAVLRELSDQGFTIAHDDVTMGHAGLTRLMDNPFITEVKIDKSVVDHLLPPAETKKIQLITSQIKSFIDYGLIVVAEGVQTAEQFDILHRAGVHMFQGSLFSRDLGDGKQSLAMVTTLLDNQVADEGFWASELVAASTALRA